MWHDRNSNHLKLPGMLLLSVFLLSTTAAGAQPLVPGQLLVSGLQGATGSTIGPGRDLFVTESWPGAVTRVNIETGATSTFAEGLPMPIPGFGIGGPVDVVFIDDTAYVLVTLANPFLDPAGPVNGIYRVDGPDSYTVIADLGAYSAANPPSGFEWFIPAGVQWAIEAFQGDLLVSDGHHNRILRVTTDGEISEFAAFGNVVPAGLEVFGNTALLAQTGPAPHTPEDGKIVSIGARNGAVTLEASGAPLLLDVESGRGRSLYALSQGQWDGAFPGSPAIPGDGALWEVNLDGSLRLISDDINLPNSMEIIGNNAYVVTLAGEVLLFEGISSAPFGKAKGR